MRGLFLLVLLMAALVQATWLAALLPGRPRPDFVLLLVVAWGMTRGVEDGLLAGVMGGLLLDLLSGALPGTQTLALGLVGLLTSLSEGRLALHRGLVPLAVGFSASFVRDGVALLVLQARGWDVAWDLATLRLTLAMAMIASVLLPLVLAALRRLQPAVVARPPTWDW